MTSGIPTKRCNKCGEDKPIEDFGRTTQHQTGRKLRCKSCVNQAERLTYAKKLVNPNPPVASKKCSKCGEEKVASEFYLSPNVKSGLSSQCKECSGIAAKARYSLDRVRELRLPQMYGITVEEYNQRLKDQDGKCAICGSDNPGRKDAKYFAIDHDHETGKVRDLLCSHCNIGLGAFKDNPVRLEAAAKYLREHDG